MMYLFNYGQRVWLDVCIEKQQYGLICEIVSCLVLVRLSFDELLYDCPKFAQSLLPDQILFGTLTKTYLVLDAKNIWSLTKL